MVEATEVNAPGRWNWRRRLGAGTVIVVILVGGAVALLNRFPQVSGVVIGGTACVMYDTRVWTSTDTVVAPDTPNEQIQGSWSQSSDQAARLTTSSGQVIELTTTQSSATNDDMRQRLLTCGIS